jgi:hypothetical protein
LSVTHKKKYIEQALFQNFLETTKDEFDFKRHSLPLFFTNHLFCAIPVPAKQYFVSNIRQFLQGRFRGLKIEDQKRLGQEIRFL